MSEIQITPLGAGQDVGRSCILVSLGGKNVMLDCGMHMGFNDHRRFPDFTYINQNGDLTDYLDCVIISHFHLDHCGALPHMCQKVGYDGPIYMTRPTKAIAPILLEDMRKVAVERKAETNFFTSEDIKNCMKKVKAINVHETIQVDEELEIKAYYAGHVLGAAMYQIKVGTQSIVYTGDFNMTPDRHLGAAWIDRCRPDLLITESTYATTIRDSKRCRERDFLKKIHDCVEKGGKVLIPVFALGRAQELCILVETYWDRMNLKVPIYFSMGLTEKANQYYKLFITWTNEKIKNTFVQRNMFDFIHIKPFEKSYADFPGPMVVFATPGMLHGGLSLQIFKKWCSNASNMIIMPGYCVAGTVGWKVLNGQRKIEMENRQVLEVKMAVEYMSFSAHADAKGIMQLISYCQPANVMLVHGEASKMEFLKGKINQEFNIDCHMPANGETVSIATKPKIPIDVSKSLIKRSLENAGTSLVQSKRPCILHGAIMMEGLKLRMVPVDDAFQELQLDKHSIRFTSKFTLHDKGDDTIDKIQKLLQSEVPDAAIQSTQDSLSVSDTIFIKLDALEDDEKEVLVSWSFEFETLGSHIFKILNEGLSRQ